MPSPLPPSTSTLYTCSIRYDGLVSEEYYLLFMIKPENICFLCSPLLRGQTTQKQTGSQGKVCQFLCSLSLGVSWERSQGKACLFLWNGNIPYIHPCSPTLTLYYTETDRVPGGRLVCFCVVCPWVYPEKDPRGRLVCFCVVCPWVYPEKGPRGRLVCFTWSVFCCSEKTTQGGLLQLHSPMLPYLDTIISYSNFLWSIVSFYIYVYINYYNCTMISFPFSVLWA